MIYYSLILNSSEGLKFISLGVLIGVSLWHMVWINCPSNLKEQRALWRNSFVLGNCFHCAFKREGHKKLWLMTSSLQVGRSWGAECWLKEVVLGTSSITCTFFFLRLNINFFKLSTWLNVINGLSLPLKMEPGNLTVLYVGVF